jgi:hypothetical protein
MNNPKTKTESFLRIGRTTAILCLGAFVVATQGFAPGRIGGGAPCRVQIHFPFPDAPARAGR